MTTFSKIVWEDFIAENPDRFTITDNGDGTVTIEDSPGRVFSEGTPVNSINLNRIENAVDFLYRQDYLKKGDTGNYLRPQQNLSDLASVTAARNNLGLGTAATRTDTHFNFRNNNLSDVTNVSTARNNLGLKNGATKTIHFSQLAPGTNDLLEGDLWFIIV